MRSWIVTICLGAMVLLSAQAQTPDSVPVSVIMPQERGLSEQLQLSGSLTALHNASLSSRTAGLVAEMLVDAGSVVTQGQP